ncbi:hypothetical protein [Arthrobacter castelli]|uniref:hypothetical protein n=1 Tax=Arthrobacter castelli TaxID=271431 RepID=UPI000684E34D|nr:hypothetical protein [Arthrobacter castelli]
MKIQPRREGARAPGLVMAGFGTLWWLFGTTGMPGAWVAISVGGGLAIGIVLFVLTLAQLTGISAQAGYGPNVRRQFALINLGQTAGIVLAITVANLAGEAAWIPALIATVVGAHFLPLARLFRWPQHWWIAGFMITVGVTGFALALSGTGLNIVLVVVCPGCAVILWASAAWLIWRYGSHRGRSTPRWHRTFR